MTIDPFWKPIYIHQRRERQMSKKATEKGVDYEGRDELYLDIDRMINEGMSGGTVHYRENITNIEEARDLEKEDPQHEIQ